MPITKSAVKAMKQSRKRADRLTPYNTRMKTMLRKVRDAAANGKAGDAAKLLPEAYKAIATAAKKGIIHHRNADRKKSLVARLAAAKKA